MQSVCWGEICVTEVCALIDPRAVEFCNGVLAWTVHNDRRWNPAVFILGEARDINAAHQFAGA